MSREDVDQVADYQATYWECSRIREALLNGEIQVPYARNETLTFVAELFQRASNLAWGVKAK